MRSQAKVLAAIAILVFVSIIAYLLLSKNNGGDNNAGITWEQRIEDTQAAIEERARINKLDKITDENIATQTEQKEGKKVLKDRRLFVNYLKSEKVDSAKELIAKLGDIESDLKSEGVEFTESDSYVVMAGYSLESQNWSLCSDFNATKKSLNAQSRYYAQIDSYCNPPTSPKPVSAKK